MEGLTSKSLGDSADDPADDPPRPSFTSAGLSGLAWCSLWCSEDEDDDDDDLVWVSLSCLRNFARRFWNQTYSDQIIKH